MQRVQGARRVLDLSIKYHVQCMRPLRSSGQRFARALDDGPEKTRALQLAAA
ncbi:MAG: hypothetical protein ACLP1Q_20970 [Solirubrobacteraceae bacterium]